MPYTAIYIIQSDSKVAFDQAWNRMLEVRSQLGYKAELQEVRLTNAHNIEQFKAIISHAEKTLEE